MAINPAIIQAGASLLGGIFGSKNTTKESWKGSYGSIIGHAQGVIEAEKRTGINPLTLLGASPGTGIAGQNAMGQAFADAAMFAADAFLKEGDQNALLLNQYQEQNRQLQDRLTHVTLQPKVPGVYGGGDARSEGGDADAGAEAREGRPLDRQGVSPLAGDADYVSPDNLTGPQASVKQDVPAFRLFGHDFYGSGLFSTGQQMEDSVGEGPMSWLYSPVAIADAFGNEAYKYGRAVGAERWKADQKAKYERDRPDRVYDGIKSKPRPKKKKHDLHALGF